MNKNKSFTQFSRSLVVLWLSMFGIVPLALILGLSFLQTGEHVLFRFHFTLANYLNLADPLYAKIALQSFRLALTTTLLCLLIGYPMAYFIARMDKKYQDFALLMLIIPFWTSILIRIYAVMTLLKAQGLINNFLMALGFIHQPLQLLYTESAVLFGMTYSLLPFMIMPLYASLEKLNPQVLEAAVDLGANAWQRFWRVILPQSWSGVIAGVTLVFLPTMTLFFIPVLLGGSRNLMLGNLIETQLLSIHDWPAGAATSVALSVVLLLLMGIYRALTRRRKEASL
jgi:spermidine/putrescine transport system permease protein